MKDEFPVSGRRPAKLRFKIAYALAIVEKREAASTPLIQRSRRPAP
jgi:hypothetical protein